MFGYPDETLFLMFDILPQTLILVPGSCSFYITQSVRGSGVQKLASRVSSAFPSLWPAEMQVKSTTKIPDREHDLEGLFSTAGAFLSWR